VDAPKLPQPAVRVHRALSGIRLLAVGFAAIGLMGACASMPTASTARYRFPKDAFIGDTDRPYEKLGLVRAKVDFRTLDPVVEEAELCRNHFNKAAGDLLRMARDKGGDAVVDVKSVVFLEDGRTETYPSAECSDEGEEGQVLAQGIAVKWKKTEVAPN